MMVAVACPEIRRAFGASVTETAWLIALYLVAMVVVHTICGWLGDALGRHRVYPIGLAWFGIGCALSPTLLVTILYHAQRALSGALIFPNGTAMSVR